MFRKFLYIFLGCQLTIGCMTLDGDSGDGNFTVLLPFLKNSANECYYLDDFMPVPDSLVAGKYGRLNLRYYTYKEASYKDWEQRQIVLSFYSQDERCWSLYEESFIAD